MMPLGFAVYFCRCRCRSLIVSFTYFAPVLQLWFAIFSVIMQYIGMPEKMIFFQLIGSRFDLI